MHESRTRIIRPGEIDLEREKKPAQPPAPIDASLVDDADPEKPKKLRFNTCMMGISTELLDLIAGKVADKVLAALDERAVKKLEVDEHTGPQQLIPEGAAVWRPDQ